MESFVLFYPIAICFVAGFLCLVIPKKGVGEGITLGVSGVLMIIASYLFVISRKSPVYWTRNWIPWVGVDFSLRCFPLSSMMVLFVSLFALLISVYSLRFMWKNPKSRGFYTILLWILGASWGVVLTNNLFVFLLFWGGLAILLYAFLTLGSYTLATKGIFTIGVADFALILGTLFLYKLSGTLNMDSISKITLYGTLPVATFLLLSTGAIAKIGAVPFHTWIPEASEKIPPPAMAFLVGALDKLVGIYFLARVCVDFFDFSAFSVGPTVLMILGSFTIVISVMMALVSSNMKRIIAYFSISAAGYMMIGMASKNPVGMAGAIFYLLSTTLWTSLLFLVAGAVERQTGTSELSSLGGLSRWMPLTFTGCLIGGLSISGVPPLNGFFSKWMIYQGVIELNMAGGKLWIIWLMACMFGSVITLASFIRMMHSVFLREISIMEKMEVAEKSTAYTSPNPGRKVSEVPMEMSLPILILAALCVGFGIFAYDLPLKLFIFSSLPALPAPYQWIGWWQPGLATILIIIGIIIGLLVYLLSRVKRVRRDISYIGGENPREDMSISGVEFYDTITNFLGIRRLYRASQKGLMDIYAGMLNFARGIALFLFAVDRILDYTWRGLACIVLLAGKGASLVHGGILHTYLGWFLVGLTILLIVFLL